jgi:hypothetical protein
MSQTILFAKVTAAFQKMDDDLTAQVNQVRRFRNWVAHGRRDTPENNVTPEGAFERLGRYLDLLTALPPEDATLPPSTTVSSPSAQPLEPEQPSEA